MIKKLVLSVVVLMQGIGLVFCGENIARGRKVTLSPKPNYALCTDTDDTQQLTDGEYVGGYFWTNKGTVGWSQRGTAEVTVDLGKVSPIGGAAWSCAAGRAGVEWPKMIAVLVSDDGKDFYPVGDLARLGTRDASVPEDYGVMKYEADDLKTYGRYVKFMTYSSGQYIFVDEVSVFAGKDEYMKLSRGEPVNAIAYAKREISASHARMRFGHDLMAVQKLIEASAIEKSTKDLLVSEYGLLESGLETAVKSTLTDEFRAVFPFNDWHKKLIGLRATIWRESGTEKLLVANAHRWDALQFWDDPDTKSELAPVVIEMMRNEIRSGVINISNPFADTAKVSVSVKGNIPAGLLHFSSVAWVDTLSCVPVAAALVPLDNKPLSIIPGMTRQLWIQAESKNIAAGNYSGTLVLDAGAFGTRSVNIVVKLFPITFPERPRLHVGGWDYIDDLGRRAIGEGNVDEVLKHLKDRYVDVPWATSATMPYGKFDSAGNMTTPPNSARFDAWTALWPDAYKYCIFRNVQDSIGGIKSGTPAFEVAVGNWVKWWKGHCTDKGIDPAQITLLLVDEPHSKEQDERILTWATIIKKHVPEFVIWEDPTWATPEKHLKAMLDISDILCPNRKTMLVNKPYRDFYTERAKKKSQIFWLYSCSGPNRLFDPYSYFLLQGWECLRFGAENSSFWAFSDSAGGDSSWNPYPQTRCNFVPFYIDATSVTPAKYMEAIAESVRDYEYFGMLRDAVEAAGSKAESSTIVEARQVLATGPARVLDAEGANKVDWKEPKDRSIADKVRVEILNLLVRLSAE